MTYSIAKEGVREIARVLRPGGYFYCSLIANHGSIDAGTPASNEAMCRCFRRLGFREEGRLRQQLLLRGQYEDHVLFGLL